MLESSREEEPTPTPPASQLQKAPINPNIMGAHQSSNSLTTLVGSDKSNTPIGIKLLGYCCKFSSPKNKRNFHKALVLLLTFIAYAAFHMGRRPLSVVKNVLNHSCIKPSNKTTTTGLKFNKPCDWAPFDDDATANHLLAYLDTAFLLSYAIFMFISGFVAERMDLRYFVSLGSFLSGVGLIAFGLAYPMQIHSMTYFVIVQIVSGAVQTTGWPVVVTCISNWFEESKRGTIYGLWNSHTSLGNILGATIAGYFVEKDWGLSFMVPGAIMIVVGLILFLFLVPAPKDVHLPPPLDLNQQQQHQATCDATNSNATTNNNGKEKPPKCDLETGDNNGTVEKKTMTMSDPQEPQQNQAVSFMKALAIPGVIEYSLCLFFSKLVSYTFLYWLPRYITSSTNFNSRDSAYLSTPFDVGGIAGAILAGYLSDKLRVNGIICNIMLILAIPAMFLYQSFGSYSPMHNILLQLIVGSLVNGPYCLITTAVSADLGTRIKDGHAMATVSAIIDGMGSIGAVLGPLFAGFVSSSDWEAVFLMLMLADVLASLCIARVTVQDFKGKFYDQSRSRSGSTS